MKSLKRYLTVSDADIAAYPKAGHRCPFCGRADEFRVRSRFLPVYFCRNCRTHGLMLSRRGE